MNILLVDDQPSVLSSLKSGLNWSALLVHNVYTALNASEAREIILSHPIDILLTDIEMPKESGLSLLRWCRENHYQFECIFLTSHADFFYAQEAIQLESFDYILQPAKSVALATKTSCTNNKNGTGIRQRKSYNDTERYD